MAEPRKVMVSPSRYNDPAVGVSIVGTGLTLPTVIGTVAVAVAPRPSLTVSVAV